MSKSCYVKINLTLYFLFFIHNPFFSVQKVAKKFKKYSKIVIAKIDAFINDLPPAYRTDIFPTIFFATM